METDHENNEGTDATLLYLHTLETLCKELMSGRAVVVDKETRKEFHLESAGSRAILNWYWKNREKWAKSNREIDVEAIADQFEEDPPTFPTVTLRNASEKKENIYLRTLTAHRFGGIHRYGTLDNAPEDFEFNFEKGLTLIEGKNGAGKTSVLNAICWCLTGHVYRAQRPPEEVDNEIFVRILGDEEGDGAEDPIYNISAITPIPPAEVVKDIKEGTHIPLDTSVELHFVNDDGDTVGTIKRAIERSKGGGIKVTEADFAVLGLDPIAREVGTKMPGLIPFIQLGKSCEVGKAVAELTGFKPLEDLVAHASKTKKKLEKDLVKKRNDEIEILNSEFSSTRQELVDLIADNTMIDP